MSQAGSLDRSTHPWVAEGQRRIRFGIFGGTGSEWAADVEWVQRIEDLGFDAFWTGDQPIEFPFDCWTHLGALAGVTKRIRLGSLVTCAAFRHPVLLARQVADADRISGGRVVLGLGIGDTPSEFAALGLDYGTVSQRQQRLEELLQILPGLWGESPFSYEAAHFRIQETRVAPGLVQPRVPSLIAGGGERVTL
ncbi:MAG TPA: LLM class flavin-dependent oxidoreductase, partial [Dehalococcoidia bacterium]|nr:LLM class flavin-dependent oxidoreductase [Dehalococcoidia bacterium]